MSASPASKPDGDAHHAVFHDVAECAFPYSVRGEGRFLAATGTNFPVADPISGTGSDDGVVPLDNVL